RGAAERCADASMEPPHECGGNDSGVPRVRSVGRLQWSRRTNAAETVDVGLDAETVGVASMEPPHECGGNRPWVGPRVIQNIKASMEPPHECGGNISGAGRATGKV